MFFYKLKQRNGDYMNFSEIFSDGLKYPSKNYLKLIIIGILSFIPLLPFIAMNMLYGNGTNILNDNVDFSNLPMPVIVLALLSFALAMVLFLFVFGYLFNITKNTVQSKEDFPDFKVLDNFVDGIKLVVVHIVYFLIPTMILFVVGVAIIGLNINTIPNLNSMDQLMNNMGLVYQILIFVVISIVLYVLFSLLSIIAVGRFAETERLGSAFQFKKVYNRITSIGMVKYLMLTIVLWIITVAISIVGSVIGAVPYYVGQLISSILVNPYIGIFFFRVVGLIYNEGDSISETVTYEVK
jgi:hypothetical protein